MARPVIALRYRVIFDGLGANPTDGLFNGRRVGGYRVRLVFAVGFDGGWRSRILIFGAIAATASIVSAPAFTSGRRRCLSGGGSRRHRLE